ncbi:MAG: bifunctional helix-turn-helix transcriptional regulator/GNAT family N-acetyltransferase [Calditrichia bacterium]
MDLIKELGELAIASRLRRISNSFMNETQAIYNFHQMDFEPRWFPTFYYLNSIYPKAAGVTDIAKITKVSHPLVNRFVKQLLKKDYVEEVANEDDKRKRLIRLTHSGNELAEELKPIWEGIELSAREVACSVDPRFMKLLEELEERIERKGLLDTYMSRHKSRRYEAVRIHLNNKEHYLDFKTVNLQWLEKFFVVEPKDVEILSAPQSIIDDGGAVFSATINDEPLGVCALINLGDNALELSKMGVYEKAQGKQIGKKLLDAAIEHARKMNARVVYLESSNRLKKALNLYLQSGFEFTPSSHTGISVYERADVFMKLELN